MGRYESVEERADRQWGELLQELRVAQTGVQILFGFLLAVVFQPRFVDLGPADRAIYVVTLVLGAATVGSLVGPVAFHRLVAGRRIKPEAVTWASRMTAVGLVLLFCTTVAAVLLILRLVLSDALALWIVCGVVLWFGLWWVAIPLWARRSSERRRAEAVAPGADVPRPTRADGERGTNPSRGRREASGP
ncbi:DUF6328 family protein (plasmid) [Streptomyces sp. BI20]|uniref:DUF6328 family protein n=1 Tax=Streptomyces sp. BI20 TaxID=3403460 RepID=UPI003C73B4BA